MGGTTLFISGYCLAIVGLIVCYWLSYSRLAASTLAPTLWSEQAAEHLAQHVPVDSDTALSPPDWDAAIEFVEYNSKWIDRSSQLIARGQELLTHSTQIATTLHELRAAHRTALRDVTDLLDHHFADIRALIAEFPISASTVSAGMLILVGTVWNYGYFGALGFMVSPLNRDIRDFAASVIGPGIVPIVLFGFYVYFIVDKSLGIKRHARRSGAAARTLVEALRFGRGIRQPHYWASRAWTALILVLAAAICTAILADKVYPSVVVHAAELNEPTHMQIIGGFGRYIVGIAADKHVLSIPASTINCIELTDTFADNKTNFPLCKSAKSPVTPNVTVYVKPTEMQEEWQSFVRRIAQCEPAPQSKSNAPLLSPVFRDDNGKDIDASFYDLWPQKWKFGKSPSWENAGTSIANSITKLLEGTMEGRPSINIIGFASGTNVPAINQRIASQRADKIDELLRDTFKQNGLTSHIKICPKDKPSQAGCIPIRTLGFGEMPSYSWAGVQGDSSKRVALVAVCEGDVF